MTRFRTHLLAAAVPLLLLAPAAYAQNNYDAPAGNYGGPAQSEYQSPHHGRHDLYGMNAQQKAVWRVQMHKQLRSVPKDQRQATRQRLRNEWQSMSDQQRQQRLTELQQRWNSMPQERQQRMLAKLEQRKQRHHGGGQGGDNQGDYNNRGGQGGYGNSGPDNSGAPPNGHHNRSQNQGQDDGSGYED
ncbi:MAG TPA: hypothetical protein VHL34_13720 [Rhizomicrobium sp.]|jgi:hypothetical protein|nr:hypothetical protein [Rhizomicrobium sp.]